MNIMYNRGSFDDLMSAKASNVVSTTVTALSDEKLKHVENFALNVTLADFEVKSTLGNIYFYIINY